MHKDCSHWNRVDSIHVESSSRCVEVPVLHLILFLDELGANFVLQLTVRPIAIGITSFSKSCFCLVRIISCGSRQTLKFAFIDPGELKVVSWCDNLIFFGFPLAWRSSAPGWHTTDIGACSLSLFNWDLQFTTIFILSLLASLFLFFFNNFLSLSLCNELFSYIFIISEILLNQIFQSAFLYENVVGVIFNNVLIFE